MAFERNTTDGIRTWLHSELSAPGWSSSSIAKSLTEDVMYIIVDHFQQFETKIRQAIILSVVYMKKNDFLSLGEGLNKVTCFFLFYFFYFLVLFLFRTKEIVLGT
ncbi:hypothetical protein BD770DRAFT_386348 [Pilaira anomala]|nr:hypothetical protein BD770DRAFT_386348 [Pilaira anomala]